MPRAWDKVWPLRLQNCTEMDVEADSELTDTASESFSNSERISSLDNGGGPRTGITIAQACQCMTNGQCRYNAEEGTPWCIFCVDCATGDGEDECACPCQGCDIDSDGWTDDDGEDEGVRPSGLLELNAPDDPGVLREGDKELLEAPRLEIEISPSTALGPFSGGKSFRAIASLEMHASLLEVKVVYVGKSFRAIASLEMLASPLEVKVLYTHRGCTGKRRHQGRR